MEAFNYPIIGSQWHPEKNDYEWVTISHYNDILVSLFFVSFCFVKVTLILLYTIYHIYRWGQTDGIPNEAINHSPSAILVAQYSADFFVNLARRNSHHFADSDVEFAALMDNYLPTKNAHDSSFVQSYYLSKSFVTI